MGASLPVYGARAHGDGPIRTEGTFAVAAHARYLTLYRQALVACPRLIQDAP